MRPSFPSTATIVRQRAARALLPLLLSSALAVAGAQTPARGYFRASALANSTSVRLELMHSADDDARQGAILSDVGLAEVVGLTPDQLTASYSGPLHFTLMREAGVFTFDGKTRAGVADGMYTFAGDDGFSDALVSRDYSRPSDNERFRLALAGIGTAFADELKAQGYAQATTGDLIRMATQGVTLAFLQSMAPVADRIGNAATLIRLRDHGIDLDYIAELERVGYADLSADALVRFRERGIDGAFITELASAGYPRVPPNDLASAREDGVTASYAREFQSVGYDRLTLKELATLKKHGVTAAFAEQVGKSGSNGRLSADDLVRAKSRGVS